MQKKNQLSRMQHKVYVLQGPKLKPVTALEAVGLTDPEPYTRALFAATAKQTSEEMKAYKHHVNVGPVEKMRQKILETSLFPSVYSK